MSARIPSARRPMIGIAAVGGLALAGVFAAVAILPGASAATTKTVTISANNAPRSFTFYDGIAPPRCLTSSTTFSEDESTLIDSNTFSTPDCTGERLTHCLTTVPMDSPDQLTLAVDTCTWR
jgi:hypothetical protein